MDYDDAVPENKPVTVLMVDDEQIVVEPTCLLLKRYGYSVISASSGEQAVNLLKQDGHNIDVVILDMLMPGMDGIETLDHIQRIQPKIPVLIASGNNHPDQIDRALNNGCNGFIRKPYKTSDLHTEIQKCFNYPMHFRE
jgi:CheY-like chemotaxis protein